MERNGDRKRTWKKGRQETHMTRKGGRDTHVEQKGDRQCTWKEGRQEKHVGKKEDSVKEGRREKRGSQRMVYNKKC